MSAVLSVTTRNHREDDPASTEQTPLPQLWVADDPVKPMYQLQEQDSALVLSAHKPHPSRTVEFFEVEYTARGMVIVGELTVVETRQTTRAIREMEVRLAGVPISSYEEDL